jgi:hypothetical protein
MPINTIELVCLPCIKCQNLPQRISSAIKNIELENRVTIRYEFKHTKTLEGVDRYSANASQTPLIIINGSLEFAGRIQDQLLQRRLSSIHKGF